VEGFPVRKEGREVLVVVERVDDGVENVVIIVEWVNNGVVSIFKLTGRDFT